MIWNDLASFLQMGGHAAYVWGSVAAAVLMFAAEMATLAVRQRDNDARARAFISGEEPRR